MRAVRLRRWGDLTKMAAPLFLGQSSLQPLGYLSSVAVPSRFTREPSYKELIVGVETGLQAIPDLRCGLVRCDDPGRSLHVPMRGVCFQLIDDAVVVLALLMQIIGNNVGRHSASLSDCHNRLDLRVNKGILPLLIQAQPTGGRC